MKMKNICAVLIVSLTFISCQPEGRVFSENQDLSPELEWLKKDVLEFKIPVDDVNSAYNMSIAFRYATGYQFEVAKVKITETSPSGVETVKEYDLKIRDKNGDYIGEAGLDIWDSEHVIESNKKYDEKGTYKYKVEQNMPTDPMHFAMELGMILDRVE